MQECNAGESVKNTIAHSDTLHTGRIDFTIGVCASSMCRVQEYSVSVGIVMLTTHSRMQSYSILTPHIHSDSWHTGSGVRIGTCSTVCCIVLQFVAVWCSVLQCECVTVFCSALCEDRYMQHALFLFQNMYVCGVWQYIIQSMRIYVRTESL